MNEIAEAKKSVLHKSPQILGWLTGAAVGRYAGINLLIPLGCTALVWWAGQKLLKDETRKQILPALSVNAGHGLWLSSGLVFVGPGALSTLGADLLVYIIGLLWLLMKPNRSGPIYFLAIYQVFSLAINAHAFAGATFGTNVHKALLVHLIWRCLALFTLGKLFFALRRKNLTPADVTS